MTTVPKHSTLGMGISDHYVACGKDSLSIETIPSDKCSLSQGKGNI